MPFTDKATAFLFENYTRNDKNWFCENKDVYINEIRKPMEEIIQKAAPIVSEIDNQIICTPRRISRIYRDARFSQGKSVFRPSVWCSLSRSKERFVCIPEFYFYISCDGYGWGCGYYNAPAGSMNEIRELILKNDPCAKAALKAFKENPKFHLEGDFYKRDKFPSYPNELKQWLNRKSLCVSYNGDNCDELFSQKLSSLVAEDFKAVGDVYKLFIKGEENKK